jgi:hypothetical protein
VRPLAQRSGADCRSAGLDDLGSLGASGGRILGTFTGVLRDGYEGWGVAAICIAVGQGLALVIEDMTVGRTVAEASASGESREAQNTHSIPRNRRPAVAWRRSRCYGSRPYQWA